MRQVWFWSCPSRLDIKVEGPLAYDFVKWCPHRTGYLHLMCVAARSHKFGRQAQGGGYDDEDDDEYGGSASGYSYNGYSAAGDYDDGKLSFKLSNREYEN